MTRMKYYLTAFVSVFAVIYVQAEDICCTTVERPADCTCNFRRLKTSQSDAIVESPRVLADSCAPGIANCADVPWAVFHNGIYWAYAAPVSRQGFGLHNPIPYGWRFATPEEFANRPPVEAFAGPSSSPCSFAQNSPSLKCLCAAHVFTTRFQNCDIGDYRHGTINRVWWEIDQSTNFFSDIVYVHDPSIDDTIVCKGDITVDTDPGVCSAAVDLSDAAHSSGGGSIVNDAPAVFPVGDTVVTFTSGAKSCSITVTVKDNEPPTVLSATVSREKLWPPNHKFQAVNVNVATEDNCQADVQCSIVTVSSDEESQWEDLEGGPYCGLGADVFELLGPLDANLCSERNGDGNGRTYTISGYCHDGNNDLEAPFSAQVLVPHSNKAKN